MSESQCALEKIIMLIITLTGKKKNKRKRQKSTVDKKKNYKNSDIPHCSHNCNKTNQHIVILLENLCSLKFFHVLQDSFKGPHLMEQGYNVNTPANYIHAYL